MKYRKYDIHPGYEIVAKLTDAINIEKEGKASGLVQELYNRHLFQFELPDDVIISRFDAPSLFGEHTVPLFYFSTSTLPDTAPLYIIIHGGGFSGGRVDYDYRRLYYLLKNVPCKVLSVDYRLAPKYPYPFALEDCYSALVFAHEHSDVLKIDKSRIAVGGGSAGASLAASLCLYARDHNGPKISAALLTFPVLRADTESVSSKQFYDDSPMLQSISFDSMMNNYIPSGNRASGYALPDYCKNLKGLPSTVVVVGEYDPLRDECINFAKRLFEAEVPCELYVVPRVPHAFDLIDAPLTTWVWDGFVRALQREFGLL